jgi:hypothetical protein
MPRDTRSHTEPCGKKAIKNRELGGSGNTCIDITRQCGAVHEARITNCGEPREALYCPLDNALQNTLRNTPAARQERFHPHPG